MTGLPASAVEHTQRLLRCRRRRSTPTVLAQSMVRSEQLTSGLRDLDRELERAGSPVRLRAPDVAEHGVRVTLVNKTQEGLPLTVDAVLVDNCLDVHLGCAGTQDWEPAHAVGLPLVTADKHDTVEAVLLRQLSWISAGGLGIILGDAGTVELCRARDHDAGVFEAYLLQAAPATPEEVFRAYLLPGAFPLPLPAPRVGRIRSGGFHEATEHRLVQIDSSGHVTATASPASTVQIGYQHGAAL